MSSQRHPSGDGSDREPVRRADVYGVEWTLADPDDTRSRWYREDGKRVVVSADPMWPDDPDVIQVARVIARVEAGKFAREHGVNPVPTRKDLIRAADTITAFDKLRSHANRDTLLEWFAVHWMPHPKQNGDADE